METILKTFAALIMVMHSTWITGAEPRKGEIKGNIVHEESKEPISYASVALIESKDSLVITGVITDENGNYTIEQIPFGEYRLKISYIGFQPETVPNLIISNHNKVQNLGTISLKEKVTALDEVVVKKERLKGEEKVDRTVFTINDDVRSSSSSGLDMLKHIPSVQVDFQENVSLEGSSNIQFYVDGVLRDKQYVAQIDPNSIDKVEIITNPGVKYDADINGVINIVLKKENRHGISGLIKAEIPNPKAIITNPRLSFEYGTKNLRFYVGNRTHAERFEGKSQQHQLVYDENGKVISELHSNGSGRIGWTYNSTNYGMDWFINESSSLNFYGGINYHNTLGKNYTLKNTLVNDHHDSTFFNIHRDNLNSGLSFYNSLYYKKEFDQEGHEISAEINYYNYNGSSDTDYEDVYFKTRNRQIRKDKIERSELIENERRSSEIKLDHSIAIGNIKQEAGFRSYMQWMNNQHDNNGNFVQSFPYSEFRQGGYYNLSGNLSNLSYQGGLKVEFSQVEISHETRTSYWSFLPQLSLKYDIKKQQNIKFSYRRNVKRPPMDDLNPFKLWTDSLHVSYGNPHLDPAYFNNLELSYTINIENNYVSPKLFYRNTANDIQQQVTVNEAGITEMTPGNIGKVREYGISFSMAYQIFEPWRLNLWAQGYNRIIENKNSEYGIYYGEKASYDFNISNIITLSKEFTLNTGIRYGSPKLTYQTQNYRDLLAFVGFEKKLSENSTLSAFYIPPMGEFTYAKRIRKNSQLHNTWAGKIEANHAFSISYTYRFNKGRKVKKIDRNVQYDKDGFKEGM